MTQFVDKKSFRDNGLENMPGGVFVYRANEKQEILFANKKLLEIFGCESFEDFISLTGGCFKGMVFDGDLSNTAFNISNQLSTKDYDFHHTHYRIRTKSGKIRYVEDFGQIVSDPDNGDLVYSFIVDFNAKVLTYDIDGLTGLPGNRRFVEYASRILEISRNVPRKTEFLILYINITKFKMYNVKHGLEKGDSLLRTMADMIKREFPNDFVSRFSDDHFTVMTEDDGIEEKLRRIHSGLHDLKEGSNISLKVGIYRLQPEDSDIKICCDLAKIACDSIRNVLDSYYCFYEVALSRNIEISDYVIENINNAIENKYIKVFYQPVIRTVSGALCGMEALARWDDPEKGFLSPIDFIGPLETSKQIYKLDSYVIEEICRNYRERTNRGECTVPVSFNLSRLDFLTCDIFDVVENTVKKYGVPRTAINIEITESVFAKDAAIIINEVERFRKVGYHVWMDDFGSGYSSLNVLKDYTFDELKIDMVFLSSFTQKSKDIIRSTIDMANTLGIQNLAEGVETKEQFDFLKSVGCGKVQGYYFSKPLPYDECIKLCKERGIIPETSEGKEYYDSLCKVNLITDRPLAIMEYDGSNVKLIYANEPYKNGVELAGLGSLAETERYLNDPVVPLSKMLKDFLQGIIETGESSQLTYPDRGKFICIEAEKIASCKNLHMFKSTVENISFYPKKTPQEELDSILRNIYRMYDEVRLLDIKEDSIERIVTVFGSDEEQKKLSKLYNIEKTIKYYIEHNIYEKDVERYEQFSDLKELLNRIETEKRDYVSGYFRTRKKDGSFSWASHTILTLPKTDINQFILLTKFLEDEELYVIKELIDK